MRPLLHELSLQLSLLFFEKQIFLKKLILCGGLGEL